MPTGNVLPRHLNHGIPDDDILRPVPTVPGLQVVNLFLSPEQQARVTQRVDADQQAWRNDLSRRVQHHGWRYDYKARAITPDMYLGQLPDHLQELAQRLYDETGLFDRAPEQVIINEYVQAQGIGTHIDHRGFGPAIATISLLEDWEMDFSRNWRDRTPALLPAGSCLVMTGQSRSRWQHGIQARRADPGAAGSRPRGRRLSLTFRTVLNRDGRNDP